MKNVQKDTTKALEVVEPVKDVEKGSTPTAAVPVRMTPKEEVENTLNYLNATYNLLQQGLFPGQLSNIHIQCKAWLENQQKALSLQMAKIIASDADKAGQ